MKRIATVCGLLFAALFVATTAAWAFEDPVQGPPDWVKQRNEPEAAGKTSVRMTTFVVSGKGTPGEEARAKADEEAVRRLTALLEPEVASLLPENENPPAAELIRAVRARVLAKCLAQRETMADWTAPDGEVFLLIGFRRAHLFQALKDEEAEADKAALVDFAERLADRRGELEERYARALENERLTRDPELAEDLAKGPEWVLDPYAAYPTERGRMLVGLGSHVGKDMRMVMQAARMRAMEDIARQIDSRVQVLLRVDRDAQGQERITEIVKRTSQASLSGVREDRIWRSPKGRVFVLAVVDVVGIRVALEAELAQAAEQNDEALQERLRRALKRLPKPAGARPGPAKEPAPGPPDGPPRHERSGG